MDAIGGPGTRVYDGVVGQCDHMQYRRLNAALTAFGNMDPRWLMFGEHHGLRKRILERSQIKDTISAIDSDVTIRTVNRKIRWTKTLELVIT